MFFTDEVGIVFEPFSLLHYTLFFLVGIGILIIFVFRKRIREYRYERRVAIAMASFSFIWELSLYAWKIGNGIVSWGDILPIGLCGFTLYIGIFAMLFKSKILFEIGYFWTWGAIASVLFPDIAFSIDRFRFYQFMIGHMFFFFLYMYMIFVYKWYPTIKSWRKSIITLITVTVILILFSNITNKNLMFMLNSEGTPFSIFEGHGYVLYLTGVILLSFCICTIWYIPFIFINKNIKKKSVI